ncbi:structural maintenance of chromosomes protein 2-1 [Pyrus ussuriensis x Pyrus communis]|uniref:Structural maintenance of chromosomes protein 2-1 n=1 Tax=Pyrus ussuriensis x Pyrus communis TaxID=2448454 RepID=A0A5N5H3H9_9ROSA|nr:structural maintenance of chromosomes protein 2-1 [Pyrus ussuriensis x Pyrus communis]
MGLVSEGTTGAVKIVEDYGDGGLGYSALALPVDELLEVGGANLLQIGNSQDKADGVEDVGLARSVQTRYGVEKCVEPEHHRPP